MKNQKKLLLVFVVVGISILISTLIWRFIKLPYLENGIIGNYSMNQHNSNNDLIRYLFFILFPITNFFILKILIEKNNFKLFFSNIRNNKIIYFSNLNSSIYLLIFFILFLILEFLSIKFPTHFLDVYHEGQRMSSAYKSSIDSSLWSGSYVTVGIFYETISSKIAWSFLNNVSIGGARFIDLFFIFISKFLLTIFAFQISRFSQLKSFYKNIFFFFLFIIFNKLSNYNINSVDLLTFREIPILLIAIFFLGSIFKNNSSSFLVILIGTLSILSLFWGIDRGLITNILIIFILTFFIISQDYAKLFLIVLSILISWISSWIILGEEFNYFILNSLSVLKEINYIHGIIHPIPFSDEPNAGRATKNIVSILICLLLSLNLFFSEKSKFTYQLKISLLMISIISFCVYFNAVGRTDGSHLRSVFGFPLIFFSTYIIYLILKFFDEFTNKYEFSSTRNNLLFIVLILIINFSFMEINLNKIFDFNQRLNNYIKLEDKKYVQDEYYEFVNKSKEIISNEECVQLFTNDAVLLYLLRKKNCTKYYFVWSIGSPKLQQQFVKDLKNTTFIIDDNRKNSNEYSPHLRLPIVNEHIKSNYDLIFQSKKFRILKLK